MKNATIRGLFIAGTVAALMLVALGYLCVSTKRDQAAEDEEVVYP